MSPLTAAAVVAPLLLGAVLATWRALRGQRRSIADVRAVLRGETAAVSSAPRRGRRAGAPGPLVELADRRFGAGLALVPMTPHDVAARVVVGAVVGAGTVSVLVGSLVTAGALPLSPLWAVVAVAAGAGAGWVMWADVESRVSARQRALRRTTNDFVQLVAVGLTTDQSVDEAVGFALGVGDSDMFDLLRSDLATAPLRGVTLWEALDGLGHRHDQRELCELATSIERQGTHGVSISETVATLARSMRERSLDELERDADRANANLAGPTVCFVCTTIVFLAFPLAMRIGEAFGG